MQVRATAPGIDSKGHFKNIGDVFDCPKRPNGTEIVKAEWYVPVEKEAPKREERGGGKPGDSLT